MLKDFLKSLSSYTEALKVINKLKLWKFFMVPALLGLIMGSIFIGFAYIYSDNLGSYFSGFWPFEFGSDFVETISSWIGGFIILGIEILLYKHILMAISAPFMGPVSEKVEEFLTGQKAAKPESKTEFMRLLIRSVRLNARNLLRELSIVLPLMLFALIPVVGLIATVLIFYYQAYYTGFGNMDYTLERHLNYRESKVFVKKNKGIAVGNGLVFILMLFIPLAGIMITLPISTVASTLDTVRKLEESNMLVFKENKKTTNENKLPKESHNDSIDNI